MGCRPRLSGCQAIMWTCAGRGLESQRCREIGITCITSRKLVYSSTGGSSGSSMNIDGVKSPCGAVCAQKGEFSLLTPTSGLDGSCCYKLTSLLILAIL